MCKFIEKVQILTLLGLLHIFSSGANSGVDFNAHIIQLIPSDTLHHRDSGGFLVSCISTSDANISWQKPDGTDVASKGRVHYEIFNEQLRLVFKEVIKEDQGNWTCKSNTREGGEKYFTMDVYIPVTFMDVGTAIKVKEDQDVIIPCETQGSPVPTIHWFHNGESLFEKLHKETKYKRLGDGLFIREVDRKDAGEYTCKAIQTSETMTNVQEQTFLLNVQYKPVLLGHLHRNKYGFLYGEVNLTCHAEGNPKPKIIWYRNGKMIKADVIDDDNFSVLPLLIKSKDSYGEYTCKAKNDLGHKEHVINLIEGYKPESPKVFGLRGLSSDTFDIDVGAKIDFKNRHRMDVNGFRFELIPKDIFNENNGSWNRSWVKDFPIADGVTYLLGPLSPDTTYLIRVASRNAAGFSDWTETKEFSTLLKVPNFPSKSSRTAVSLLLMKTFIVFLLTR